MMTVMTGELLAFAGIMALGQFSPGPDMILVTRTSLKLGSRAGVHVAFGIATGLLIHATLAVAGLALVLDRAPLVRGVLYWLAALYLVWLAYQIGRETFVSWYAGSKIGESGETQSRSPYLQGFLCNVFNPKVVIILAALATPFLKGEHPDWWPVALWAIIVGQGFSLWSLWAGLLQWRPLREGYQRASRWIDAAFALALVALAAKLVIA